LVSGGRPGPGGDDAPAWPHRYPYPAYLDINGNPARGRDISHSGVSAYVSEPFEPGEVVVVRLGWAPDGARALTGPARVVRSEPDGDRYIVALEFLPSSLSEIPGLRPPPDRQDSS
jgi:hypothetical protein